LGLDAMDLAALRHAEETAQLGQRGAGSALREPGAEDLAVE